MEITDDGVEVIIKSFLFLIGKVVKAIPSNRMTPSRLAPMAVVGKDGEVVEFVTMRFLSIWIKLCRVFHGIATDAAEAQRNAEEKPDNGIQNEKDDARFIFS